ncbi:hypothetical protein QTO34_005652 [Cnephaeus nilssonii]|uniref:Uncharacterized protein n=1 Tax=Cnephaeus nilssonii TaxID=3371016 RepID=A0AA40HNR8_CNENI|nr:hypothetical protein QTO34_005652 [Eptesicus nilssonii]
MDDELLLMDECYEDCYNENQNLEDHINLVNKVVAMFERIYFNFERNSAVEIVTATLTFRNHNPDQSVAITIKTRPSISKKNLPVSVEGISLLQSLRLRPDSSPGLADSPH